MSRQRKAFPSRERKLGPIARGIIERERREKKRLEQKEQERQRKAFQRLKKGGN